MHFRAAAAMTPSGVPPMPKRMSAPVSGQRGRHGADHVAVRDEADAGPGGPHLGDEVLVAGPVEDDGGDVADRLALGLGDRLEVLGVGVRVMSTTPAASGPTAIFSM